MSQIVPIQQRIATVRTLLEKSKQQIALALPRHLDADRLSRIAMTSIQKTPKLLDCTPASLIGAVIQSAQLGLEPDGVLGLAYLVPYKQTCQLIVGYRGMIDLARRSGQLSTIYAHVVHRADKFKYSFGLNETCEHTPSDKEDPGEVTHAYAVAKMKDGSFQFDVMTVRELEAIRARSRAAEDGPWVTDREQMYRKTILRRLCKILPCSVELARAVALDERAELGIDQQIDVDLPTEDAKPKGALDRVVAAHKAKQEAETIVEAEIADSEVAS